MRNKKKKVKIKLINHIILNKYYYFVVINAATDLCTQ